jgi:hypothetical protein
MTLLGKTVVVGVFAMLSAPVLAYIGPGSGISLLSGLWGILVAIVLAVGAVLIWPIRYLFRRIRRRLRGTEPSATTENTGSARVESPGPPSTPPSSD